MPGSHTHENRGLLDFMNTKKDNIGGLHSNQAHINEFREAHMGRFDDSTDPDRYIRPFRELGLSPGPVNSKAGDLIIFGERSSESFALHRPQRSRCFADTSTFHAACPATDPGADSTELRRAICIMSMVPRLLLSPTIIEARQLAYEVGRGTGGTVMAREGVAENFLNQQEDDPQPKERSFADASPTVRKCVGDSFDFTGAPPQSRIFEQRLADARFPTAVSGSVVRQTHRSADERIAKVAATAVPEYRRRQAARAAAAKL